MVYKNDIIYLDYAATTPVADEVIESMLPFLMKQGLYANSDSNHFLGKQARHAVETAREAVLEVFQGDEHQLIWTSGATEANNLAISGILLSENFKNIKQIITCKTEHKSVIEPIRILEQKGFKVTYLNPDCDGLINIDELDDILSKGVALVSIMMVNNETGVIQDIPKILDLTKKHKSLLHCDCVQAFGKLNINLKTLPIDLLTISGHKIYAPKGIGALLVDKKLLTVMSPRTVGGDQEFGLRAGTTPTALIIAMSKASELIKKNYIQTNIHTKKLSEALLQDCLRIPECKLIGHPDRKIPGIINLTITGVEAKLLQKSIEDKLAISLGSACTSRSLEPSYVLRAMRYSYDEANSAIRISVGRYTTENQIKITSEILTEAIKEIRQHSVIWKLKQQTNY